MHPFCTCSLPEDEGLLPVEAQPLTRTGRATSLTAASTRASASKQGCPPPQPSHPAPARVQPTPRGDCLPVRAVLTDRPIKLPGDRPRSADDRPARGVRHVPPELHADPWQPFGGQGFRLVKVGLRPYSQYSPGKNRVAGVWGCAWICNLGLSVRLQPVDATLTQSRVQPCGDDFEYISRRILQSFNNCGKNR